MADLRVAVGSLTLGSPVLAAAGTFGYGVEFARALRLNALGAVVTKTLTRAPRDGHPPPRLVETPSGLLNAVGLQNIGVDRFLQEKLPALRRYDVPIFVSILGESHEELVALTQRLDRIEGVAGIELNLSCPNMGLPTAGRMKPRASDAGGAPLMVAQDAEAAGMRVRAARQHTTKPLIAKLSPDVTDLGPIAQAAERAGADALSIGNTFLGMSVDPATRRSRLGTLTGGLSGPAIRPLAVYRVWYTAQFVRVPIIGIGGIVRAEDALEFFLAGAAAVAVGTAHFADPAAAARILRGLRRYLARHQMDSMQSLRGALSPSGGVRSSRT